MLKRKNGFTLLEIIITIAIVGILFSVIVNILPFILKINKTATDLSQVQSIAQMTLLKVENQLRYANSVNIESNLPSTQKQDYKYIYLSDGKINSKTYGSGAEVLSPVLGFEDYTYNINFVPVNAKVIEVNLYVFKDDEQIYSISSKTNILNLGSQNITGVLQGNCIAYQNLMRTPILVSSITVTSPTTSIDSAGQTLQLSANAYPAGATNKGITWSVDKPDIALITQDGLLTSLRNGIVTVIATALDGSGVIGIKQIIISNQIVTITSLHLNTSTGVTTLKRYGFSITIMPSIAPTDATNQHLTWSVDNPSYATIDSDGVLTSGSIKNKSVVVTATTKDGSGITATIEIQIIS